MLEWCTKGTGYGNMVEIFPGKCKGYAIFLKMDDS